MTQQLLCTMILKGEGSGARTWGPAMQGLIWRFPRMKGTILGVPIIRTIAFRESILGTLIFENYHIGSALSFAIGCFCSSDSV